MGKKSIKRRTQWRTLSITDSADEAGTASSVNCSVASHNEEVSSKDDIYRHPNTSYLRRKPLYDTSHNARSDYSRSYYKQHRGSFSSRSQYYRRPVQNGASRFFNYRNGAQNNRSFDANKEYNQARPIINEEEYTRITTPRQDVIFKKGYLSQPRKYLSSTDTNTTSSAAASVVSTEESISAASVPSLSPEQCSSHSESVDPEQAFMYSYFDQNGIFYFNPYLPNGFDQYAGQMFMLPYSYQPYNVYPSDVNSPPQSTDIEETPNLIDSNENLSDSKETDTQGLTPESPNDCDEKTNPPKSEKTKTTEDSEKSSEDVVPQTEKNEITTNHVENFYNYGYQQFYPQMFFPYMYGQQFMPMIETDYEPYTECCEESDETGAAFKNRRTRKQDYGSSTGIATTDCSEEDYSDKENISDNTESMHTNKDSTVTALEKSENTEETKKITFNADVKEFVPRQTKPHLNVNVKEFLPKNYKPKRSTTCIEGKENNIKAEEVKAELPKPEKKPTKNEKKLVVNKEQSNSAEDAQNTSVNIANVTTVETAVATVPTKPIVETSKLTLAERIKKGFGVDNTDTEQSSPPKNNSANLVNKKSLKKNELKSTIVKEVPGMTFAKILTKDKSKPVKSQIKTSSAVHTSSKAEKYPAKETAKEIEQLKSITITSEPIAEKDTTQDEWQTVKPKGKRSRHFVKEVPSVEELPIEKEALDQKVPDEIVHKEQIIKVNCEVPDNSVNEKYEDKVENEIILQNDEIEGDISENPLNFPTTKNSDLQNLQKKNKVRNKKTKKNPSPVKKVKEKKIVSEEREEKTEKFVEGLVPQKNDALLGLPNTKTEDHLLDSLYLMDRNNSLLSKRFCRNPLEILNGFDCKFKGSKSILKEEEDMVLNVIKSLSTNQAKTIDNNSPKRVQQDEKLVNESIKKNSPTEIEKQCEIGSSSSIMESADEKEVCKEQELQDDTNNPLSNGMSTDCEADCSEYVEEETIIQEIPQEIQNAINDKLSDTESISDLSVEEFEKKGETKDCLTQIGMIVEEVCSKNTYLIDQKEENQSLEISNSQNGKNESYVAISEEKLSCQSSQNSLEANGPKDLTIIDDHDDCRILPKYNLLEQSVILEDNILISDIKTEIAIEKDLEVKSFPNDSSNEKTVEDENKKTYFVLETSINVKQDVNGKVTETTFEEDLVLKTTIDNAVNGAIIEETAINQEINETFVDKVLLGKANVETEFSGSIMDDNFPKADFKTEEIKNKIEESGTEEVVISTETNSTISARYEKSIFENESFEPFKHNSEDNLDIETTSGQKIIEIHNNIPQDIENVANCSGKEENQMQLLKEHYICLPEEVSSVKIVFTESQAPEKVMPQCESNIAGQENENNIDVTIASSEPMLEKGETENSYLFNTLEGKDVVSIADLSGDLLPGKEKVCESDLQSTNSIFMEQPLDKLDSPDVVIDQSYYENCMENKTSVQCPQFIDDGIFDVRTELTTNTTLSEDDLSLERISPANDSGIISPPISFCQISSKMHDSNKSNFSTINIPALDEDPSKYPLTMAVREWLNQETKEKTPEPILRIPDDPKLSSIITSSIIEQSDRRNDDFEEWISEESDDEEQDIKPKNLISNPSRVSSVNFLSNDNDSDYNSDSQLRFDEDDNACERVATIISDITKKDDGDPLDYWDDEFVRDPKKWLNAKGRNNDDRESVFSTTPSERMAPYESVYGKSIDYERLLASNYEFLSNNIISFNDMASAADNQERMNASRLNNDNFGTNINGNHNCLKPPEVCCMIM